MSDMLPSRIPMPASPLEPTAMDAACACAACASAGVEITPRAQLGGAAVICKASRFAMVVVDGGGQRQLVMLFILFALLACALAVRMLAGAEGSDAGCAFGAPRLTRHRSPTLASREGVARLILRPSFPSPWKCLESRPQP